MGGTRLCLPRVCSYLSFSIIFSSPLLPLCTVSSACGTHCEDNAGSVDADILDSEGDRRDESFAVMSDFVTVGADGQTTVAISVWS